MDCDSVYMTVFSILSPSLYFAVDLTNRKQYFVLFCLSVVRDHEC